MLLACDAGTPRACVTSMGIATGMHVFSALPPGRYHLVVDADRPGTRGRGGAAALRRRDADAVKWPRSLAGEVRPSSPAPSPAWFSTWPGTVLSSPVIRSRPWNITSPPAPSWTPPREMMTPLVVDDAVLRVAADRLGVDAARTAAPCGSGNSATPSPPLLRPLPPDRSGAARHVDDAARFDDEGAADAVVVRVGPDVEDAALAADAARIGRVAAAREDLPAQREDRRRRRSSPGRRRPPAVPVPDDAPPSSWIAAPSVRRCSRPSAT